MATETATLIFKADTEALKDAERRLKLVEQQGKRNEQQNDKTGASFKRAAAGAAALAAAVAGINKMVDVAREFDVINSSLVTMTGNQAAADRMFKQIQQFAAKTPYDLAQVATAFTTLKARGLDPSMDALRSYGNTAAAMGKSLEEMVRAAAQASVGEFETLRSFGIVARAEGENLAVTFNGVTTKIGRNAGEIEKYLINIGNTDFAGAMDERAKTLDGTLSNLGDSWDALWLTISKSSIGELTKETASAFGLLIDNIDEFIRKGQGRLSNEEKLNAALERQYELATIVSEQGDNVNATDQRKLDEQNALIASLRQQIDIEKELEERQKQKDDTDRAAQQAEQAAAKKADAEKKAYDDSRASAEEFARNIELLNATELDAVDAKYKEMVRKAEEFYGKTEEDQEKLEQLKTEIALSRQRERLQLLEEQDRVAFEAQLAQWEADAEAEQAIKKDKDAQEVENKKTRADALASIEDGLLGKLDERKKKSAKLALGLADQERRNKAKEIITDSYAAAMKAYQSLAPIPIVGPALGAAAFAATIAMGAQAASQALQGRALGGQVRAGESYVVGERGPEVLTMGATNGRITTNEALRGQSTAQTVQNTANVSFVIQANDTAGFDDLLESRRGQIVNMINMAMNESGRVGLV